MPYQDIQDVEKVWSKTKEIVGGGNIIKDIKNGIRSTNFPGMKFSKVTHVRPHGVNANDTYPLPVPDKFSGAKEYTKQR